MSAPLPADLVGAALRGPHRQFALGGDGPALRYPPQMGVWAALAPGSSDGWEALAALPGDLAGVFVDGAGEPADGWRRVRDLPVLQMTGRDAADGSGRGDGGGADGAARADGARRADGAAGVGDDLPEPLTRADVPEMLDLTARTQPGPFLPDTIRFGGYFGIRRDGRLVAMAGRRLHVPGWVEVSAICTDPAFQGQGLARRVTEAVIRSIRADGAEPFLHVLPENAAAVHLYESIGFVTVDEPVITIVERICEAQSDAG